jgi:hypothetical protein
MQNDPELSGKYLGQITKDFVKVSKILQEASYQMRVRKISQFPIFPISRQEIPIGQILMDSTTSNLDWNYHVSYLEEFVERNLIVKPEHFKEAYKDADEFCCLFVIDVKQDFTKFVFIPFPEDD